MTVPPHRATLAVGIARGDASGSSVARQAGRRRRAARRIVVGGTRASAGPAMLGSAVIAAAVVGVPGANGGVVAGVRAGSGADGGQRAAGSRPDIFAEAGPGLDGGARAAVALRLGGGEDGARLPARREVAIALREELCRRPRGEEERRDETSELHGVVGALECQWLYSDPPTRPKLQREACLVIARLLTSANGTKWDDVASGGRGVKVGVGLDARLRVNEFGLRRGMRVSAAAPMHLTPHESLHRAQTIRRR